MNKTAKFTILILGSVVATLSSGCASYSFRGAHGTEGVSMSKNGTWQYRLRSYECEISHPTMTPWSIARFAGATSTDQNAVEGQLRMLNPQRWANVADAIPVDIRIGEAESDVTWFGGTMSYLLTLGCWPANIMTYEDKVPVTVRIGDREMKGGVRYRSKGYLSVLLPFALWRTDDQDGYTGEHRRGNGLMTAPHISRECLDDMKEVFVAEIAAEVNGFLDNRENGL